MTTIKMVEPATDEFLASLEAKKLSLEHGCEMSLNAVREDCH